MKRAERLFAVVVTAIFIWSSAGIEEAFVFAVYTADMTETAVMTEAAGEPTVSEKGEDDVSQNVSFDEEAYDSNENPSGLDEQERSEHGENLQELERPEMPEDGEAEGDLKLSEGQEAEEDLEALVEEEQLLEQEQEILSDSVLFIDLGLAPVRLTAEGYQLGEEAAVSFQGTYHIQQTGAVTANQITVEDGSHRIVIEDVSVDRSLEGGAAFSIGSRASVILELTGSSVFKSGNRWAGVQLCTDKAAGEAAALTVTGSGTIRAFGGESGAGIGGGYESSNGQVVIEDGVIFAQGGRGGAGIGGGDNSSSYKVNDCGGGIITITGGEITAIGGDSSAGIGGGNHGDGGEITITGGVIELAQGGGGGAGIGSGLGSHVKSDKGPGYYTGGKITLSGDYLVKKALGGGNAAGIGGGMYADSGKVVILGGRIQLAQGGDGTEGSRHHGASGIGAGYQGHCDVFIRLARIEKAIGSFSGAGIGSGATANKDRRENDSVAAESKVFICSSYIDLAQGGIYGGAGIGGGVSCDYVTVTLCGHRIVAQGGPGGAGVGSGAYREEYSYSCGTKAVVHIKCGGLKAEGGDDGEDIGSGSGNEEPDVLINVDETDLTETPSVPDIDSDGYEGYYDGRAYGINVMIQGASITYSLEEDGLYEEEKPLFVEVGEYLTYYRADKTHYTFYGSEKVVIKPLADGGDGGAQGKGGDSKTGSERVETPGGSSEGEGVREEAKQAFEEPEANFQNGDEPQQFDDSCQNRSNADQKKNPQTGVGCRLMSPLPIILTFLMAAALCRLLLKGAKRR